MEYSRVVKFQEYRDSFTKENSVKIDTKKSGDLMSTTNTLPYEQVIKEVESEEMQEAKIKQEKFKRIYMMVFLGIVFVALTIGLIFLGILAFSGGK